MINISFFLKKKIKNKKMVKIQYVSDLHLEFNKNDENYKLEDYIDIKGDFLILAGDIGNPYDKRFKNFIIDCCSKFVKVIMVAGNHEYYFNDIEEVDNLLRTWAYEIYNFIFLQQNYLKMGNILILGCTLWSKIHPGAEESVKAFVNDYKNIKNFTVERCNEIHNSHLDWLKNRIEEGNKRGDIIIVITHYPLIFYPYKKDFRITDCAFENDYYNMLSTINYSISGHIHKCMNKLINGCEVHLNCRGYYDNNKYYKKGIYFSLSNNY